MIECPACGYQLRPGTLFCTECGIYLPTDAPLPTEPLPEEELPASQADLSSRTIDVCDNAELSIGVTVLHITVARSTRQVLFPLPIHEIYLGRGDVSHGVSPDLDLTPDGGLTEGVSRHHARIYQTGNRFFVEDADSTNGTFLNKRRLVPYESYVLRDGDTLHLGRLQLLVEFNQGTGETPGGSA